VRFALGARSSHHARQAVKSSRQAKQALNLRIMQNKTLWRAMSIAFCALVFFFALHAKTAVYDGGSPGKVTPSTASKMWSSGQKMEAQPIDAAGGLLFWMAVLCLFAPCFHREIRAYSAFGTPPASNLSLWYSHQFLRPPPVQA
jgi:hypothetical protein